MTDIDAGSDDGDEAHDDGGDRAERDEWGAGGGRATGTATDETASTGESARRTEDVTKITSESETESERKGENERKGKSERKGERGAEEVTHETSPAELVAGSGPLDEWTYYDHLMAATRDVQRSKSLGSIRLSGMIGYHRFFHAEAARDDITIGWQTVLHEAFDELLEDVSIDRETVEERRGEVTPDTVALEIGQQIANQIREPFPARVANVLKRRLEARDRALQDYQTPDELRDDPVNDDGEDGEDSDGV